LTRGPAERSRADQSGRISLTAGSIGITRAADLELLGQDLLAFVWTTSTQGVQERQQLSAQSERQATSARAAAEDLPDMLRSTW
jgi:hypothetical protein